MVLLWGALLRFASYSSFSSGDGDIGGIISSLYRMLAGVFMDMGYQRLVYLFV